ncbi:hypothetical protein BJV78DRAFT_1283092 [Lactifluus subvellereus]|nr:hypothetical protein BJV78DRAFT_1283092 [Lactifluus subvellereus]
MNNPRSMVVGWVSLITVAGVSFYFAKQSINERRRKQDITGERPSARLDWKQRVARDEAQAQQATSKEPLPSPDPVHGSKISGLKDDAT